jgi:hypothetical protein
MHVSKGLRIQPFGHQSSGIGMLGGAARNMSQNNEYEASYQRRELAKIASVVWMVLSDKFLSQWLAFIGGLIYDGLSRFSRRRAIDYQIKQTI